MEHLTATAILVLGEFPAPIIKEHTKGRNDNMNDYEKRVSRNGK